MKKFIVKFIFFQIPILCYITIILLVLTLSGELLNSKKLASYHNNENVLLGLAYSDPINQVKLIATESRDPKIIALGTSRVMQFRDFFFSEPGLFYNAGGAVTRIKDFNAFLNNLQAKKPKIFIIALDQYFFNEKWDDMTSVPTDFKDEISTFSILHHENVFPDLVTGKINMKYLLFSKHIGLTAQKYQEGFRSDGSYRYGRVLNNPDLSEHEKFETVLQLIKYGTGRFQYAQAVNHKAIQELDAFLGNCSANNIYVVAYLPPYPHVVWNTINSKKNEYPYVVDLYKELEPIFTAHAFDLFDFSDVASLGASDSETIDGFHCSEVAYLRLFIQMSEKSEVLKSFVDSDKLKNMLENAVNSLSVKNETLALID